MQKLKPSMRLKVKKDTYFLPDLNGGVYFRSNSSTFRLQGKSTYQWVEKLMPMLTGEHSLNNLTDGLPSAYKDVVYEILEIFYLNGIVRDVTDDLQHQLPESIFNQFVNQIEFIDNLVDSGAYRFQLYRQSKVLAVGSGPFLISLVDALLESGLPKFGVIITDSNPTNRHRLHELEEFFAKTDCEVAIKEVVFNKNEPNSWRKAVSSYESILYVNHEDNVEELKFLQGICKEKKKMLLPAIRLHQVGIAGPLINSDSVMNWESAWRRLHLSSICKDQELHNFSSLVGAMLANIIVFELFKELTGVSRLERKNTFFLIDLETLEGKWHSFIPHPLVNGATAVIQIRNINQLLNNSLIINPSRLLYYFSQLTSEVSGIFHVWEEADLIQLPLAQCRVKPVNPLSEGPAELLKDIVCAGMTHIEARREAGLAGVEAYVSQLANFSVMDMRYVGIGVGETAVEGVYRGLQKYLTIELAKQLEDKVPIIKRIHLNIVEDERCRFYLQSLITMKVVPIVCLGDKVAGFPVLWLGVDDCWYASVNLNITLALQDALKHVLQKSQNSNSFITKLLEIPAAKVEEGVPLSLDIPRCQENTEQDILKSALQVLDRNKKQLLVFDLALEPFLKDHLISVFGVTLEEEESI